MSYNPLSIYKYIEIGSKVRGNICNDSELSCIEEISVAFKIQYILIFHLEPKLDPKMLLHIWHILNIIITHIKESSVGRFLKLVYMCKNRVFLAKINIGYGTPA